MSKKDPLRWMPLDVADWLLDGEVSTMTLSERAVYLDLLCHEWIEGSLPNDEKQLAKLGRCTIKEWVRVRNGVLSHYVENPQGRLTNQRCQKERSKALNKIEQFRRRTENASRMRWASRNGSVTVSVTDVHNKTLHIPPSSSPPPTDDTHENGNGKTGPIPAGHTTVFDTQAEAETLTRRYDELGDEAKTVREVVDQCLAGLKPGARVILLRDLAQFPPGQVALGCLKFVKSAKADARGPYLLAIVRNCGSEWSRAEDEREKAEERRQQNRRKVEAAKARSMSEKDVRLKAGDIARDIVSNLVLKGDVT